MLFYSSLGKRLRPMRTAEAFAPAHITGLFQIYDKPVNLLYKGSKGAGVSLKLGVTTRVNVEEASEKRWAIWINGQKTSSAKVSEAVVDDFLSRVKENFAVKVEHEVQVPVGAGFGSSGAAALSLAIALNEALNMGLTRIEAAQIAHIAEIKCKTGLGTVIAETFGGLEIRTLPGAPGIGKIQHISISNNYQVVCLSFGRLSTRKALTDAKLRKRINKHGEKLLELLMKQPTVENFLKLSRKFAENTGLITERIRRVLYEADSLGIICSMPIFGEGVFSITKRSETERVLKIFQKHASLGKVFVCEIDFEGARLL
jgi:pantoate kinase